MFSMHAARFTRDVYGRVRTYRGDLELLRVADIVHADFPVGQKAVALDLAGKEKIAEQFVVSSGEDLVEDVVASFSRLLLNDTRLLEEICVVWYHACA